MARHGGSDAGEGQQTSRRQQRWHQRRRWRACCYAFSPPSTMLSPKQHGGEYRTLVTPFHSGTTSLHSTAATPEHTAAKTAHWRAVANV